MRPIVAAAVALCVSVVWPVAAFAANPEPIDIDAELAAKVAKEKAKAQVKNAAKDAKSGGKTATSTNECGINIGNVDNSRKGVGSVVDAKSTTVVITGPVVNVGNKCK